MGEAIMSMGTRQVVVGALVIALGLALGGCDKMPWASKEDDGTATAAPGVTTAQSGQTPMRPVVAEAEKIATVNGVPLSKADLRLRLTEEKLARRAQGQPERLSPEELESVLRFLMESELASQEAVKRGLDRDPDTQQRWEYLRRTFFSTQWVLQRRKQLENELTDTSLANYYETIKAGFRSPERRRVRHIAVATEAEAKEVLARLLGGSIKFEDLVHEKSLDAATKAQGGLINRWIIKNDEKRLRFRTEQEAEAAGIMSLDAPSEAAVFAIDQVSGLSSYIKGMDNRYHVYQLAEREAEQQPALSDVKSQVKELWLSVQIQQEINGLISKGETAGQITKPADTADRLQDVQREIDEELKQP